MFEGAISFDQPKTLRRCVRPCTRTRAYANEQPHAHGLLGTSACRVADSGGPFCPFSRLQTAARACAGRVGNPASAKRGGAEGAVRAKRSAQDGCEVGSGGAAVRRGAAGRRAVRATRLIGGVYSRTHLNCVFRNQAASSADKRAQPATRDRYLRVRNPATRVESFPGGPHRGASKLASGQGQGLRQDSTHRCHNGAAPGPTPARRLGPLHRDWHWQWARPAHGLPAVSRVTGPPLHRPLRFGAAVAFSSRQAVDCMARRRAVVSLRKFPSVRFGLPVELTEIRFIKFSLNYSGLDVHLEGAEIGPPPVALSVSAADGSGRQGDCGTAGRSASFRVARVGLLGSFPPHRDRTLKLPHRPRGDRRGLWVRVGLLLWFPLACPGPAISRVRAGPP